MTSGRLKAVIDKHLLVGGKGAREALCVKAGISYSTLSHLLAPGSRYTPRPKMIVRIALACGCTEEEAVALAGKASSQKARKAG